MQRAEAVFTHHPWRELPPALSRLLRPRLTEIHTELILPQTARYRIRQLEVLFGKRLNDPEFAFEAMIALRTRTLELGGAPRLR